VRAPAFFVPALVAGVAPFMLRPAARRSPCAGTQSATPMAKQLEGIK
jgi:hypothetical protein